MAARGGSLVRMIVDDAERIISPTELVEKGAASERRAIARSRVTKRAETASSVAANTLKKGDVLGAARYAGVQAAKISASLFPLSRPTLVRSTSVDFEVGADAIDVEATVEGFDTVDFEMSALSAVTAAALTIYDMCKSADRTMTIGPVELVERTGHSPTTWRRDVST